MQDSASERIKELEWSIECASRIIVKKQESCSRQLIKLLTAEGALKDLKRQVSEKDNMLRKNSWICLSYQRDEWKEQQAADNNIQDIGCDPG